MAGDKGASAQRIVEETLEFVQREMTHKEGGFYSSLDADSEGVEGKFYVWTLEEIRETLKEDSEFFEAAYGISANWNWEGKTVLQRALDDSSLAVRFPDLPAGTGKIAPEAVAAKLADCHFRLLTVRSQRVRPGTDDKIITAWNGLMLAAFAEAARVLLWSAVLGEGESFERLLKVIWAEYRPGVVTAASVFPPEKDALPCCMTAA